MATDSDVAIVGGGPVGLALALDLGGRGVRCVVVERHESPQPVPKGQNLTQRTMEHFRWWGIEDEIRSARVMPAGAPTGGVTAYGTLLGGYTYDWWQRAKVRPYYYTDNERLPQYRTEAVLRAAVAALPSVTLRVGWTAEGLEQTADSVEVDVRPTMGGPIETISANHLVGCDGSHSIVRLKAGIAEHRADHDKTMALLVFRSPELNRLLAHHRDSSFFKVLHPRFDGYWQFLGRVDADEHWFFHAPIDDAEGAAGDEAQLVYRAVGAEFAVDVEYSGTWDLRTATAASYRAGRVFLAGDAAHSHPPYGGFGINLGLEDARNLGWKLAATIGGWGGERLLDSYDAERRPVFSSTASEFIEGFIERDQAFVRAYDPARDRTAFEREWDRQRISSNAGVRGFEPNYEGSPIVVGGQEGSEPSALGSHSFEARAGHHLPPARLSSGATIDTAFGSELTLIALGDPTAAEAFGRAARWLHIPLEVVSDSYRDERERYRAPLILLRPDHFVAWVGKSPDDPDAILRCATGRPPSR